jgi:hypothetical protein
VAEAAVLFARISSRLTHRWTEHAFEEENAETDSNAELAEVAEFFLQESRRAWRARRLNRLGGLGNLNRHLRALRHAAPTCVR